MHEPDANDQAIAGIGRPSGFRTLVGYKTVAWSDGYSQVELQLEAKHFNSHGIPHGGLYMTMIDAAMGHAATFCDVPGRKRSSVTISLQTNFLAPGKGNVLRAEARLVSIEGRLATCHGEVFDLHGTRCAVGQGSFRYTRGSERREGVPIDLAAPVGA